MVRREFLKSILTAAAAGSLLASVPAAVNAAEAKYVQVIAKAQQIVALDKTYSAIGAKPQERTKVNEQFDDLLGFMMQSFDTHDVSVEDIQVAIVQGRSDLTTDKLQDIAENVVPVAVVKSLLHMGKVRAYPDHLTHWNGFLDHYAAQLCPQAA